MEISHAPAPQPILRIYPDSSHNVIPCSCDISIAISIPVLVSLQLNE
jgi:hypothetical protein